LAVNLRQILTVAGQLGGVSYKNKYVEKSGSYVGKLNRKFQERVY